MFQEGSQGSANIAQKLHTIINEFSSKNSRPDVILLDNSIIDSSGWEKPWFEALVRVLVKAWPDALIVSIIDAVPNFMKSRHLFVEHVIAVQKRYGLVSINLTKMVRQTQLLPRTENGSVDLLWPQTEHLISPNGTEVFNDMVSSFPTLYWTNFLPRVQVARTAHNPHIHAPWPTHQYVADVVLYSILTVIDYQLGCSDESYAKKSEVGSKEKTLALNIDSTTVAKKELVDSCFICLSPMAQFDGKSSFYEQQSNTDSVESTMHNSITMCGDWMWTTDDRHRSGWQSDKYGSLIRFRLRLNEPFVSMTYMRSYSDFGSLLLSFHVVLKEDAQPVLGCKNSTGAQELLPWFELSGKRLQYSLYDTITFSSDPYEERTTRGSWELFNNTVLRHGNAAYVDIYVFNPNKSKDSKIKIQTVTSC
jgi:hypothetical protein